MLRELSETIRDACGVLQVRRRLHNLWLKRYQNKHKKKRAKFSRLNAQKASN